MKEEFDFRLFEREARSVLPDTLGVQLSSIARRVLARRDAEAFEMLRAADRLVRDRGGLLVASWNVRRTYSARELAAAEVFRVQVRATFDPPGEVCGTEYGDDRACPSCGANAPQRSALRIDPHRVPRGAGVASSIAGEIVASRAWVEAASADGVTGVRFMPVERCPSGGVIDEWRQVVIEGPPAMLGEATAWGHTPFDLDPVSRCLLGHVGGLNILSELHLDRSSWSGSDFGLAYPAEGERAGVLRPRMPIVVSRRGLDMVQRARPRDVLIEVAHLD